MTCCPSGSYTVVDGVTMHGHRPDCMKTIENTPRTYVWQVYGTLAVGTLADYAKHLEKTHYSGDREELSSEIRTWDKSYTPVVAGGDKTDDRDYFHYTITVENEYVSFSIDGRA